MLDSQRCFASALRRTHHLLALAATMLLVQDPAAAQPALPGCPINLCAIGVELGNAHALARWADPYGAQACADIHVHVGTAAQYLPLASRTCAQAPNPPWPVFQDWPGISSRWGSFLQQHGRGRPWCPRGTGQPMIIWDRFIDGHDGMNDSQLYFELGGWVGNLAAPLLHTAFDRQQGVAQVQIDPNTTCGGIYLVAGALLGYAQVVFQQRPPSASYAYNDAIDKYQTALTWFSRVQLPGRAHGDTSCGDFSPIVGLIEAILQGGRRPGFQLTSAGNAVRQGYLQQCEAAGAKVGGDPMTGWMQRISSGASFRVALDATSGRIGNLAGGEVYTLTFRNGSFTCTGLNMGTGGVGTWVYSNANLNAWEISLWGAVYTFNERGEVFRSGRLAGHLLR